MHHDATPGFHLARVATLARGGRRKRAKIGRAAALYFVWYNWVRIHKAHKLTPAMAAGITDKLMEMKDIVGLMDNAEMKATIQKRVGMLSVPQSN
jgi:hypothetical protein